MYRNLANNSKLVNLPSFPIHYCLQATTYLYKDTAALAWQSSAPVNVTWKGEKLIHWHHECCGKSEETHAIMKNDLAGGKIPSGDFGENTAWWWMIILSLHLGNIMKSLALGKEWQPVRLKALRFHLLNQPSRVVEHAPRLRVKLSGHHPIFALLLAMQQRNLSLSPALT